MGDVKIGQAVGTWQSAFGEATITAGKEIGKGFKTEEAAAKAAFGHQAVITKENGQFHVYEVDDGALADNLDFGTHVTAKPANGVEIVDFVGDDNYQLKAEKQTYPPTGPDNGQVVYFLRHFDPGPQNGLIRAINPMSRWDEEIQQLRDKGYTVIVDPHVNGFEMIAAFEDPRTAGIIYNGHGETGMVAVDDGKGNAVWFDLNGTLDKSKISPNLKMMVWQSCRTNGAEEQLEELTGADSVGWTRKASIFEVAAANDPYALSTSPALSAYMDLTGRTLNDLIDDKL